MLRENQRTHALNIVNQKTRFTNNAISLYIKQKTVLENRILYTENVRENLNKKKENLQYKHSDL